MDLRVLQERWSNNIDYRVNDRARFRLTNRNVNRDAENPFHLNVSQAASSYIQLVVNLWRHSVVEKNNAISCVWWVVCAVWLRNGSHTFNGYFYSFMMYVGRTFIFQTVHVSVVLSSSRRHRGQCVLAFVDSCWTPEKKPTRQTPAREVKTHEKNVLARRRQRYDDGRRHGKSAGHYLDWRGDNVAVRRAVECAAGRGPCGWQSWLLGQLLQRYVLAAFPNPWELYAQTQLSRIDIGFQSATIHAGKSYSGINDELIVVSICMAILIAVLIAIALCYIVREKCNKHREYFVTAWRFRGRVMFLCVCVCVVADSLKCAERLLSLKWTTSVSPTWNHHPSHISTPIWQHHWTKNRPLWCSNASIAYACWVCYWFIGVQLRYAQYVTARITCWMIRHISLCCLRGRKKGIRLVW